MTEDQCFFFICTKSVKAFLICQMHLDWCSVRRHTVEISHDGSARGGLQWHATPNASAFSHCGSLQDFLDLKFPWKWIDKGFLIT